VRGGRRSLLGLLGRRLRVRRRLLPVEIVDGTLRVGRSDEDRAPVVPEHGEPIRDVGRVILARLEVEAEVGREEGRAQLRD
jgi:hypothetical protein